ncbi:MAG TPA: hypothetical protein VFW98_03780 [Gemmatimonadaceae bacterium]|nr:hypothetical protein [Gemmatimonadaceae bacterium]
MMGLSRQALLLAALAVWSGGCTEVGTNPDAFLAIELQAPTLPSMVQGDTLRDSTGVPVPLRVTVLNGRNDTVTDAPVRFLALDTGIVAVDSVTGLVTARDTTGQARIIASAGALQSAPVSVIVTLSPDSLQALGATDDTLRYSLGVDSSRTLSLRLAHDSTPGVPGDSLVPVPAYLVRFAIVAPAGFPIGDSTQVMLVDDSRRGSALDTTDAQGSASRRVLVPRTLAVAPPDSLVIEATAVRQDRARSAVPGSPVRFVVHIRAGGP